MQLSFHSLKDCSFQKDLRVNREVTYRNLPITEETKQMFREIDFVFETAEFVIHTDERSYTKWMLMSNKKPEPIIKGPFFVCWVFDLERVKKALLPSYKYYVNKVGS